MDSCQLPRSTSEQQQQQAQENERTARKDILGIVVDATPAWQNKRGALARKPKQQVCAD